MHRIEDSPLGKSTTYVDRYDPALLYPVERAPLRGELGIGKALPFSGWDIWNAYELSWLNGRGKPRVALASFRVPADSANIVESKSLKLYLNSFNQTRFPGDEGEVSAVLQRDLNNAFGGAVEVELRAPSACRNEAFEHWDEGCLDELDVEVDRYAPAPELLSSGGECVEETLCSNLLKSNCPITGQPDWASLRIDYRGPRIEREGLLRYIISFRSHGGFHEHCVERIFMDLMTNCRPERLTVYARYLRRGGLDINPFRGSFDAPPPGNPRLFRQ